MYLHLSLASSFKFDSAALGTIVKCVPGARVGNTNFVFFDYRAANNQCLFLIGYVAEWGEPVQNLKWLVVNCGILFGSTFPLSSHTAIFVSQLLGNYRGISSCANSNCGSAHAGYRGLANHWS